MSAAEKFHLSPTGNLSIEICDRCYRVVRWINEADGEWAAELAEHTGADPKKTVLVSLARASENPAEYLAALGVQADKAWFFLAWLKAELAKHRRSGAEAEPGPINLDSLDGSNILAGIDFGDRNPASPTRRRRRTNPAPSSEGALDNILAGLNFG